MLHFLNCAIFYSVHGMGIDDGDVYNKCEFFQNNDFVIQVFQDEFEVCNPLGSKVSLQKLCGFYFTINNLPIHMNASLNNIHLLALAHAQDIKSFTIKQF